MKLIWSIKDLVEVSRQRQSNEFDCNIIISGSRGNGKSSLAFRFLSRFGKKKFNPWKHQVYSRKEVIKLIEKSKYGCIFDDEAIRTGYKRNFYDEDQKTLIQMLNMYRDNYNIYVACLPTFYDLDRGLRDMFKIHIHVIERGLGVIHVANENALYSDDKWDVKRNQKIEESWAKYKQKNPNYKPKFSRLTTFRGFIRIPKLTPKMESIYKEIKATKRKEMYDTEIKEVEDGTKDLYENIIKRLKEGKMTESALFEIAQINNMVYSNLRDALNKKLKNNGEEKRVNQFFAKERKLEPLDEAALRYRQRVVTPQLVVP